jgi:hypothetical protein
MERDLVIIIIIMWLLFSQVKSTDIKQPIPYVRSMHEVFTEEELLYIGREQLCE